MSGSNSIVASNKVRNIKCKSISSIDDLDEDQKSNKSPTIRVFRIDPDHFFTSLSRNNLLGKYILINHNFDDMI